MNVTALTRANFSANVSEVYSGGSSYTRCVWEVYLGNVDLCVGDFWETDERRRTSMFTSALDSDFFKLGTMPSGPVDSLNILGIFKPFHADLWTLNVFMIIISGLAIWFVEKHTPYNSDYDSEVLKHKPLGVAEGMAKAVWLKMATYVFGDPMVNSTTWPGRLIVLGFGFFCYITSSSYTANLASFMISDTTPVGFISKFGDIATMSGGLCLLEAMDGSVDVEGMTNVPFDDFIPALEGLYRGDCLGVMVGSNEWKIMVRGGIGRGSVCVDPKDTKHYSTCEDPLGRTKMIELSGCKCKSDSRMDPLKCPGDCPDHQKYCSIVEVIDDDFNFYVNLAMPVSLRIQNYVSAWVIALRQDGTQSRLQQKYIKSVYHNVCEKVKEVSDSTPLSPSSMVGTFVTSGVIMMIGLIWFWVQTAFDKYHIKPVLIDEKICMDPSLPKPRQKRLSMVVMETNENHMQSFQNLTSLGKMSNRSLPDSNGPDSNKFDSSGIFSPSGVGKGSSIFRLLRKASSKSKADGEGYDGQGAGAASADQSTQMSQRITTKWPNAADQGHVVEQPGLEPHGSLQELGAGWPRDSLQLRETDEGAGGVLRREYEELCDRVLRHQRALAGRLMDSSPSPTKPRGGDHLYSSAHSAMLPDPEDTTSTAGHGFSS